MFEDIVCSCGNRDQDKFVAETEIADRKLLSTKPPYERRNVYKFIGWRCLKCQKVHEQQPAV